MNLMLSESHQHLNMDNAWLVLATLLVDGRYDPIRNNQKHNIYEIKKKGHMYFCEKRLCKLYNVIYIYLTPLSQLPCAHL